MKRPTGIVTDWRGYDFETGYVEDKDDLDFEEMVDCFNSDYAWSRIQQVIKTTKDGFTHIVEWVDGFGDSVWYLLKIEDEGHH